ncbi:methyltransferase domain-containing protein [Nitratireductor sp. GCM10026969]|uniref:methyltransferase domain-containing protein n=1 Tax=Nitratireductor sp. GCM10026969 TaxID=3252645 RepID=UPI00361AA694
MPFIEPLKQVSDKTEAVDLGCGRGEWLQFLRDQEFQAQGVDLDEGMLASCRKRGLKARKGDALEFLREMPDDSQVIVSGFHIAEHLPFAKLQRLVREAHRVLMPGGLLILETPNPENFRVSTLSFYMDPTHLNPLPPDLLSFLTEFAGFKRNKVIRLQENERLRAASSASLDEVLGGASPDFAVVAQKESDAAAMALFDEPFGKEYGLGASTLVERFDRALSGQDEKVEALAAAVEEERLARSHLSSQFEEMQSALTIALEEERLARSRLSSEFEEMQSALTTALDEERLARSRLSSEFEEMQSALTTALDEERLARSRLSSELEEMQSALSNLPAKIEEEHAARRRQAEASLAAVYASTSWRITAPLRAVSEWGRWFVNGSRAWLTLKPGTRPRRVARALIVRLERFVLARPWSAAGAKWLLRRLPPPLETRLRRTVRPPAPAPVIQQEGEQVLPSLSPRARQVHAMLKTALAEGGKAT